jgi:hypothetical protein
MHRGLWLAGLELVKVTGNAHTIQSFMYKIRLHTASKFFHFSDTRNLLTLRLPILNPFADTCRSLKLADPSWVQLSSQTNVL